MRSSHAATKAWDIKQQEQRALALLQKLTVLHGCIPMQSISDALIAFAPLESAF